MKKSKCPICRIAVILLLMLNSCEFNKVGNDLVDNTDLLASNDTVNNTEEDYYSMPAPSEVISYFKENEYKFRQELMNPLSNYEKYNTHVSKILNVGIYTADATYQILCKKTSKAASTFKVIESLCNEANISSAFDENIKNRIIYNSVNADSITDISIEIYLKIVNNIRETGSPDMYLILASGSFVEIMYLMTNSIGNFSESEKSINKVVEQKLLFDELFSALIKIKKNEDISGIVSDMSDLKSAFDLLDVKSENIQMNKSSNGNHVLSGKNIISYSEKLYINLKTSINKLRSKWTVN
ncbi:MAG TPA: hypothetical protein DEH02_11045 [Bacteroidales bacterium]|nr:MAG: hypothetical protein A2X01_02245 [Bacteroidetes bacterium GWF2_35_48]HBX51591.1 hypothetical protein [Bacteroidales bacterium]